jgi:signal transduction histidine kinase/DNA-binding response OmpR family regulator
MSARAGLLTPARWVMDRLTYPRKFLLVSLLFLLPLVLVLYFLLNEVQQRVAFTEKQLLGTRYLLALRDVQQEIAVSKHIASQYVKGDGSTRPNLIRQQASVDDAMARLEALDSEMGNALDTASRMAVLRENRRFLRQTTSGIEEKQIVDLHAQLLADVALLNIHVANTSNLILDPDLDSYYLMDAATLRLPVVVNLLSQLRLGITEMSDRVAAQSQQKDQVSRLAELVEAETTQILNSLKVSVGATKSPTLKARLSAQVNAFEAGMARLSTQARITNQAAAQVPATTAQFDNAVADANSLGTSLSNTVYTELDELLKTRIHETELRRLMMLLVTAISVLVVIYLLSGFYASVMGIVQRLRLASQRMGTGDFSDTLILNVRDELGEVSNAFNMVAMRLRAEKQQSDEESARARAAEAEVREQQQQLVASREEALAAARAKAAFLATMSHEIRTPLNGVVGMSTLLGETNLTPEQRDYLETIRLSSDQLLAVINDILDFSKIESGKLELESEPLSLRTAVEEACDIAAPRAREKGLELIIDIPEPRKGGLPSAVLGDVTRLRQVLINLINNAVKFTDKGEVSIHLRLLEESGAHGHPVIEFRVTDTGIGIPAERVSQLFQAFTQGDTSTTRKYGGTGLGLAISKRIVEMMDGHIGVESELGKGSTFWFTMEAPASQIAASFGPADLTVLRGSSVLIVDDNATNVRILRRQFQLWGVEVASVASAEEALTLLDAPQSIEKDAAWQPDIIVTDMHMPGMDGATLAQRIKALPKLSSIPLVLLSSGFMPSSDANARLFAARLLKPARQNQLFDTLARCLQRDPAVLKKIEAHAVDVIKNITVLVADDNAVNLKVASAMLRKLGYGIVTTIDGAETVKAMAAAMQGHPTDAAPPFGAILMDVNMPGVDGLEATRQIQAAWGKRSPPIIALTAAATDDDRARCMEAGMDDFLTKPLQVSALAQALEKWTTGLAGTPSIPPAASAPSSALNLNDSPLFDDSRLREFIEFDDKDRSMTREVIKLFVADAPQRLQEIEKAMAQGNDQALKSAAHALKGAASNIGAVALQQACSHIEAFALAGDLASAKQPLSALPDLVSKTLIHVNSLSATLNSKA